MRHDHAIADGVDTEIVPAAVGASHAVEEGMTGACHLYVGCGENCQLHNPIKA